MPRRFQGLRRVLGTGSIASVAYGEIASSLYFALGLVAFRTFGGQYSGRDREGLIAASIFWYVTVAVYAVIWFTIFVTK